LRTLYIIGNGFDLFHSLPTSYKDFQKYLSSQKNAVELMYSLNNYFDGDVWSDFETAFGKFSIKRFLYDNEHLLPDENSDRDGERYILPDYAENVIKNLIVDLYNKLNDWIVNINNYSVDRKLLSFEKSSFFLTFNYTDTLERVYNILESNILHLHGQADKRYEYKNHPGYCFEQEIRDTEIIFGHAFNPLDCKTIAPEKKGASAFVEAETIDKLLLFFHKTMKNTTHVMQRNSYFFDIHNLSQFDKIVIFGHSMSEIDLPYFRKILSNTINVKKMIISYYQENKRKNIEQVVSSLKFKGEKTFVNLELIDDIECFDVLWNM